jgi:DNA helicase-2/ATP-dependent DNA helicase PcrA
MEASVENESRMENIEELGNALAIWEKDNPGRDLSAFLEEVALVSDVDSWEKKDLAVNMMTMHCAMGLEFRIVFLSGLKMGSFHQSRILTANLQLKRSDGCSMLQQPVR